jgi:threonine dehydrogenase-like Zn-dependent dehydrogenase
LGASIAPWEHSFQQLKLKGQGMRALILDSPETIRVGEIDDINEPDLNSDEMLLAVAACGICGGDIKVFKGVAPLMKQTLQFPRFMGGHELVGHVVAMGKEVTGFSEGDLVSNCFASHCGTCLNCRLGRPNFCLNARWPRGGGFAERAAVYAPAVRSSVFKVPAGIGVAEAALSEPITCAIGAVLKAAPSPGDRVAVIGLGGMGQFIAQSMAAAKAHVIGIDVQQDKLRKAATYCAEVINAAEQDAIGEVMRLTGGIGADVVMEVVGVPETFKQSLELARMGGRIVVVGAHNKLADGVNIDRIFRRDLEIKAAKGPSPLVAPDGTPLAFRYIQEGIVRPKDLLTTFPFVHGQDGFSRQAHGDVIKGVVCHD